MRKTAIAVCVLGVALAGYPSMAVPARALRPPAVPLVTVDPFFSVWSAADRLTDVETTHWTGAKQPVTVLFEADGRTWRLCGATPADVPALPQLTTEVRPTQTVCTFAEGALRVELRFSTAKLPDDLDVFSRPVTYVTARVQGARTWRLKPSISAALATNDDAAPMVTNRTEVAVGECGGRGATALPAVSIGRRDQTPLGRRGARVSLLPPELRGVQARGGPERPAVLLLEGERVRRPDRHDGRVLPAAAAPVADESRACEGHARAHVHLRRVREMALPLRAGQVRGTA